MAGAVFYSESGNKKVNGIGDSVKATMRHLFYSDSKLAERLLCEVASLEERASYWGKIGHHLRAGKLLQEAAGKMKDLLQISPKPTYSAKYLNLTSDAAMQYAHEINVEHRGDPETFKRLATCWSVMANENEHAMFAIAKANNMASQLFLKIENREPDYQAKIRIMSMQRSVLEQLFEGEGNEKRAIRTANKLGALVASQDAETQGRIGNWVAETFSEYGKRKADRAAIAEAIVVFAL